MDAKLEARVDPLRDRSARLFEFIAALHERRNPPLRRIAEEPWQLRAASLPEHPAIAYRTLEDTSSDVLLRVERPERTPRPPAPSILNEWLPEQWNDCEAVPAANISRSERDESGQTRTVWFQESPQRVAALEAYRQLWENWAVNERVTLAAAEIFDKLYQLHGMLQREGEQYELVVGDGLLVWRRPEGGVRYPLLTKRVGLEFLPEIPEFRIVDGSQPTEVNSALFRSMEDVDGRVIARLRGEAEELEVHPLGEDATGFLRSFVASIAPHGRFEEEVPVAESDEPVISRSPMFFMRKRTGGFASAIANIITDIREGGEIPASLTNIVGISTEPGGEDVQVISASSQSADANEDENVLFTKPANAEQLRIAQSLARGRCVLVQGPPGTGKTHTIANLLGHLLAQGKSVLVTSHTTKALKVLRDKVVPQLQALCLCVLDDSNADNGKLKSSVEGIVERLGSSDAAQLERDIAQAASRRTQILKHVGELRASLLEARSNEYRDIVVGGESFKPLEAAKFLAEGEGKFDWLPGPVTPGAPAPLSEAEAITLFASNAAVTEFDERSLGGALPSLADLPSPEAFAALTAELRMLESIDAELHLEFWNEPGSGDIECLDEAARALHAAIGKLQEQPEWIAHVADAAERGEADVWTQLIAEIERVHEARLAGNELFLAHDPQLPADIDYEALASDLSAIAREISARGKAPGFLALLVHKSWKIALESCRVASGKPSRAEHFEALAQMAQLVTARERLRGRWSRQVTPLGGPDVQTLGAEVEVAARRFRPSIEFALSWKQTHWREATNLLEHAGLRWNMVERFAATEFADRTEIAAFIALATSFIPEVAAAERARRRRREIQAEVGAMRAITQPNADASSAAITLDTSVCALNAQAYKAAYDEVARLSALISRARERAALLERVRVSAAAWASQIQARIGPNGASQPPSDIRSAWLWRQFTQELARRDKLSADDISRALDGARSDLREATADVVDARAWRSQIARTSLAQRQALMGFAKAKQRIGRGTGKNAGVYAKHAREAMTQAQSAVPVWIMPLVRVAEMYDARKTKFDVVIVDEASQSDVTGLFAYYLGKQTVVVGDDEQVSPSAVGEKSEEIAHLIAELLEGIPNAPLYGGQLSLYDLAKQSFGGVIALREHFRCTPEIIAFSNELSYNGSIKPLRERLPGDLRPGVVAHRVAASEVVMNVNEREAREVAALIAACIEQPEYDGKTFGVISLVGEQQARRIEELVRGLVDPAEIEERKLIAGNPAQFQGDERNVMFLSLVDAPGDGPKSMRQEHRFQQRFNVAASRGQDQMWVVHSLDSKTDLQAGDLRRRLIEHALDPEACLRAEAKALERAESPFEQEVIRRLAGAGYRFHAQHAVGAYRIDLVVEGAQGRRVALECDGDRFHTLDDLERDLERQSVLERLGWNFVRLRGTQFYRDPEGAMKWLAERLAQADILPGSEEKLALTQGADETVERVRRRAAEIIQALDTEGWAARPKRGRRGKPAASSLLS